MFESVVPAWISTGCDNVLFEDVLPYGHRRVYSLERCVRHPLPEQVPCTHPVQDPHRDHRLADRRRPPQREQPRHLLDGDDCRHTSAGIARQGMAAVPTVGELSADGRSSLRVPAHLHACGRHAVGDADTKPSAMPI